MRESVIIVVDRMTERKAVSRREEPPVRGTGSRNCVVVVAFMLFVVVPVAVASAVVVTGNVVDAICPGVAPVVVTADIVVVISTLTAEKEST